MLARNTMVAYLISPRRYRSAFYLIFRWKMSVDSLERVLGPWTTEYSIQRTSEQV